MFLILKGMYINSTDLTGSIAICAMILPGISGSFILLLLSKYEFIINSIKDFKFDVLIVFALGCIFGLLLFSRFLSYLFLNYKDYVLSLLSGFLFGSLLKVWPFKTIIETRINSDGIKEAFVTKENMDLIMNLKDVDSLTKSILDSRNLIGETAANELINSLRIKKASEVELDFLNKIL